MARRNGEERFGREICQRDSVAGTSGARGAQICGRELRGRIGALWGGATQSRAFGRAFESSWACSVARADSQAERQKCKRLSSRQFQIKLKFFVRAVFSFVDLWNRFHLNVHHH
jgi:hypothetical protein